MSEPDAEETMVPPDYQRILAAVRRAVGPVMARQVGEMLGANAGVRASWDRCAEGWFRVIDHGWLRQLSDDRLTTRL
ncbi:hypothetical protein AB0G54_00525 [Streptomyces yokosukanensis]|uniref:hypothetical protein n=1 Tax=Streptomyces yokosukanensis TaxID=67386 RepID=UPI00343B9974